MFDEIRKFSIISLSCIAIIGISNIVYADSLKNSNKSSLHNEIITLIKTYENRYTEEFYDSLSNNKYAPYIQYERDNEITIYKNLPLIIIPPSDSQTEKK